MQLQEQPQPKLQPIKVKMDVPKENFYKMAKQIHADESTREAFKQSPGVLAQEFGLDIDAQITWELGKKKRKGGDPAPTPEPEPGEGGSDAEVLAVCAVIASDVVVGLVVCGVVALAPEEPVEISQI
jgi:hypothetical protein